MGADLASLKKIVAIQQAEINAIKRVAFSIGSIQQSLLSEDQFQALMGKDWVLMDGRDCSGSIYASITGANRVPDASGLFLRMAGGASEDMGIRQGADVSLKGVSVSGAGGHGHSGGTTNDGSHKHSGSTDNPGDHSHSVEGAGGPGHDPFTGDVVEGGEGGHYVGMTGSGSHTHNFNTGNAGGHAHSFTTSSVDNHSHALIGGGVETRPVNMAVNYFIRIN